MSLSLHFTAKRSAYKLRLTDALYTKWGSRMFFRLIIFLLLLVSHSVHSTQDEIDAEKLLPLIRSFLSNPTVLTDINSLVQSGCVWSSESIWLGSGVHVNEKDRKEIGGGFTVFLKTQKNESRMLRYLFSAIIEENGGYTVSSIRYNNMPKIQLEC